MPAAAVLALAEQRTPLDQLSRAVLRQTRCRHCLQHPAVKPLALELEPAAARVVLIR